jgi:hypothetical protein
VTKPNIPTPAPTPKVEMKPPSVPNDIADLLKSVGVEKKVVTTKKGGSTGKNSVSIRL